MRPHGQAAPVTCAASAAARPTALARSAAAAGGTFQPEPPTAQVKADAYCYRFPSLPSAVGRPARQAPDLTRLPGHHVSARGHRRRRAGCAGAHGCTTTLGARTDRRRAAAARSGKARRHVRRSARPHMLPGAAAPAPANPTPCAHARARRTPLAPTGAAAARCPARCARGRGGGGRQRQRPLRCAPARPTGPLHAAPLPPSPPRSHRCARCPAAWGGT